MGRGDDVSFYSCRALDRFKPLRPVNERSCGNDFGYGLAVAGDADGFAGDTHLFEKREALGFEFGDGDFDQGFTF
jgi:hypothetical protein